MINYEVTYMNSETGEITKKIVSISLDICSNNKEDEAFMFSVCEAARNKDHETDIITNIKRMF